MRRTKKRLLPLAAAAIAFVAGLGLAGAASAQPSVWYPVDGAMGSATSLPAAVALPDGRVLVIGGQDLTPAPLNTVDIYDSATNAWLPAAAPMNSPRVYGSAVLLQDGRVLIVGGINSGNTMSSTAEIYDPATDTWTLTAALPHGFAVGAAATLNDGRVLAIGGVGEDQQTTTAATMIFDPWTGTWTSGPDMLTSRYLHNANLLQDGRVLVSGGVHIGVSETAIASAAEVFDPLTDSWSPAGQMNVASGFATTGVLDDGRVIVAGGSAMTDGWYPVLARVEVYDPATNQWSTTAPMSKPRAWGGGGVTAGGKFVMAGGLSQSGDTVALESSAERYDPDTGTWSPIASLATPRFYVGHAVVNGRLLLAGGAAVVDAGLLLNSGELLVSENDPPLAVASAPATVQGLPGSLVVVEVSAADSSDPDGNPLKFVWSEGGTTLAMSNDPTRTALVGLGIGPHTLTLTVSDGYGGVSTATAFVTVVDATAGQQAQIIQLTSDLLQAQEQSTQLSAALAQAQAQITQLTGDLQQAQAQNTQLTSALQQTQAENTQLASVLQQTQAQLAAAGQSTAAAVTQIQTLLQAAFPDPSFVVPGGDSAAQLQAIIDAVEDLKHDGLLQVYRSLKPASHGGHDRDDDHGKGDHGKDEHGKGDHKKDDHKKDDHKKGGRGR